MGWVSLDPGILRPATRATFLWSPGAAINSLSETQQIATSCSFIPPTGVLTWSSVLQLWTTQCLPRYIVREVVIRELLSGKSSALMAYPTKMPLSARMQEKSDPMLANSGDSSIQPTAYSRLRTTTACKIAAHGRTILTRMSCKRPPPLAWLSLRCRHNCLRIIRYAPFQTWFLGGVVNNVKIEGITLAAWAVCPRISYRSSPFRFC